VLCKSVLEGSLSSPVHAGLWTTGMTGRQETSEPLRHEAPCRKSHSGHRTREVKHKRMDLANPRRCPSGQILSYSLRSSSGIVQYSESL